MTEANTLCIICCMTYQSPTDDGAGAASPANEAMVANGSSGALRTVLVCDVVDSVHWMQVNEAAAIAQWQTFIDAVKQRVIPKLGGRLVKSLGDGLMLEFLISPQDALNAAFAMKEIAADIRKADTSKQDNFWLRMALHHTTATVSEDDIYGHGVNLCARIATLAGPGEIVISTEMRDQLTDQLDADLEDMGECFLKHIEEPVRVYRAGPVGMEPVVISQRDYAAPLHATLAVVPFVARSLAMDNQLAIGEIIADGVIGQLSRTANLKVISRLSTSVFRNRISSGGLNGVADIEHHLGANYILSGSYIAMDKQLIITAELTATKTNQIVWMDRMQGHVMDLLQLQSEMCHKIANATHMAILETEVQAALTQPMPTLESYSLLLGGISMSYFINGSEFQKAGLLLNQLADRYQSLASPYAWLANWHALRATQHNSLNSENDSLRALAFVKKALVNNPMCAQSLATDALLQLHLSKNKVNAEKQLATALQANPSEPLAWLFKGVFHGFLGDAEAAREGAEKALALSPIGPSRHYFESLASSCFLGSGDYDRAIALASSSIRTNSMHPSTYRTLAVAQAMTGDLNQANITVQNLLKLLPNYTTRDFEKNTGFSLSHLGEIFARALSEAGLPS
jgi:adenylate cyclase